MKSKFFIAEKSADTKIVGDNYPQCSGLLKSYDEQSEFSIRKFAYFKGIEVDFKPNLDGITIHKKTKITDFISCSIGPGNDSIINSKVLTLLKEYKKSEVQLFDCFLYQGNSQLSYTWVHYIYSLEKFVDYSLSTFTHPNSELIIEIKKIKSYESFLDFYDTKDEFGFIKASRTVIKELDLEFFVVGRFNQKLYVSERLMNKMIDLGITGIEYKEADDIESR